MKLQVSYGEKKNMLEFASAMYVRYQKKKKSWQKGNNKDRKRKFVFVRIIQKYYGEVGEKGIHREVYVYM